MFENPAADFLHGDEFYRTARAYILRTVTDRQAVELIGILANCMGAAHFAGRVEERRRQAGSVALATIDPLLPCPCCCTSAEGYHCTSCHGQGHAPAALPPAGQAVWATVHDDDTVVIPRMSA